MRESILIISAFHENSPISRSNMAYTFFKDQGYRAVVVCSSFSHSLKKFRTFDNTDIITFNTISYNASLSLARIVSYGIFVFNVYRFLEKNKFDLVYVNLPPNIVALPLLVRRKNYNRLIVDVIDLWPEAFPAKNGLINFLLKYLGHPSVMIRSKMLANADYCITESHYFLNRLNLINKDNAGVIHIKKPLIYISENEDVSLDLSIVYLGNIGNIYDFKSLVDIINGVKQKRKVVLHILGDGILRSKLLKILDSERVEYFYHGASFDEDFKRKVLSICWFGFNGYKSNTEVALSYKSVDYLSYGVPLLNSAKEDTINLVTKEGVGYNYNCETLEEVIKELSVISKSDIIAMKKRSYQVFQKYFSETSYRQDMCEIISSIGTNTDS